MTKDTGNRPNQPPEGFDFTKCWPERFVVGSYEGQYPDPDYGIFDTLAEAEELARSFNANRPDWHTAYGACSLPWRYREGHAQSNRVMPVWHQLPWYRNSVHYSNHFLHVSTTDRTLLAYTQDDQKGARNVQTPIKPGRYLTKFFGDVLTAKQIAFFAAWQTTGSFNTEYSDATLYPMKLATTPDDIVSVYVNGPTSCMSHGEHGYDDGHPCRIYGAGDLAVAYLAKEGEDNFRPVARCLVWPEKKVAGRVYPNTGDWSSDGFLSYEDAQAAYDALVGRLVAEGYKFPSEHNHRGFNGARLERIEIDDSRVVMPYLDGGYNFNDHGDWLEMHSCGRHEADNTNGSSEIAPRYVAHCERCEDGIEDEDSVRTVHGGYNAVRGWGVREQTWCSYCEDHHAFYCHGTEEVYDLDVDHITASEGHDYVEAWAVRNGFFQSDYSGEWFGPDDGRVELEDGSVWSCDEFSEHGFVCRVTGENYDRCDEHPDFPGCHKDIPQGDLPAGLNDDETETAQAA